MRILTINLSISSAFTAMGHEVLSLSLPAGIHYLHAQTGVSAFEPELVIQQEALGKPALLVDIDSFLCPKAFWSIDTHINIYWHRYYGRLFDVFFTPHADLCAEMPAHWQHPYTCRLPFVGLPMAWRPHGERSHNLNFVGRLTAQRPLRERVIQFFQQRYGMPVHQDLSRADMMTLYADTRVLPNETIAFESNFRLLEGASSGCCIISPHIGADQDAVLTPGKEVLTYSDALECMELTDFCLRKPRMAEAVGRMAWERVQAEHLPKHRAAALLQAVATAPASALQGEKAQEYLWCSAAELELNGDFVPSGGKALWECDVYRTPSTIALRLRSARHGQDVPRCADLLQEALHILPQGPLVVAKNQESAAGPFMAEAAAAMGLYCLQTGDLELAHAFGQRVAYCLGVQSLPMTSAAHAEHGHTSSPSAEQRAISLALVWADSLYNEYGHWYLALELLSFVSMQGREGNEWTEPWMRLRPVVRHFPLLALSALARMSLNKPDDVALHAAYIGCAIRCFRLQEAQDELAAFMINCEGSPQEALCHAALREQCQNIHRLHEALQPFS